MDNFYESYWAAFMTELERRPGFPLKSKKVPKNKNWIGWSCFGRKGFKLLASLDQHSDWICINFGIDMRDQKHHFSTLYSKRLQINSDVGLELRWDRLPPEKSATQAVITKWGVDVQNRSDWVKQHAWMLDVIEKLYTGMLCHIEALPAN
ncbi:DUF4268 domain-containing protein [Geomonas subterranea]|uniref:DUF4268 domain-containing protein n=1 Tax=Geomonas subterranea TaxID=2847989 RepID=UPI001CD4A0CF|nr:DUF4268 domain-containing protein [Geomonas fuzhouensis]